MSKRFLISLVATTAIVAALPFVATQVAGQGRGAGRGATLAGPAPRTLDNHPDFTGVYDVDGVEDIRDNLAPDSEIRFTPAGAAKFKTMDEAADPNARCLPWGPTRMMCCTRHPIGFVMNPQMILILTESQQTFRIVYMDGRPLPTDIYDKSGNIDRQSAGWFGFSRGKWEGDTLVVETIGPDERTQIDGHGMHPHTEKMKLTERFTMKDRNTVEYSGTVDDPPYYQKPWTFLKTFKRLVGNPDGDRILSHACLENEKDVEFSVPTLSTGTGEGGRTKPAGRGEAGRGY
jgi:hypothetical protein